MWVTEHFIHRVEPDVKVSGTSKNLNKWFTKSQEALLFVLIENSYGVWKQESEYPKEVREQWSAAEKADFTPNKTLWTYKSSNGRKFDGWNDDGIKRFNKIVDDLEDHRGETNADNGEENRGQYLESKLKRLLQTRYNNIRKRKTTGLVESETSRTEKPRIELPIGFEMLTGV